MDPLCWISYSSDGGGVPAITAYSINRINDVEINQRVLITMVNEKSNEHVK